MLRSARPSLDEESSGFWTKRQGLLVWRSSTRAIESPVSIYLETLGELIIVAVELWLGARLAHSGREYLRYTHTSSQREFNGSSKKVGDSSTKLAIYHSACMVGK